MMLSELAVVITFQVGFLQIRDAGRKVTSENQKAKGKRQKAKMKKQKLNGSQSLLLPFAFCLLPFDFPTPVPYPFSANEL
jgi:hypothetical protein